MSFPLTPWVDLVWFSRMEATKYPRTRHLPWSPGRSRDDLVLSDLSGFSGIDLLITEKMDGENTTLYRDGLHARSVDYSPHPSRDRLRAMHAGIAHEIPEGFRICGENLYARHSIGYTDLPSHFLVFSIWDGTKCLSWEDTVEWCDLLGLVTVPVLGHLGPVDTLSEEVVLKALTTPERVYEGYVVRPVGSFQFESFGAVVGKFVRPDHVTTTHHWMHQAVVPNGTR